MALTLRNVATDRTISTAVSGANGEYAFRNLPPAKYSVEAIKTGFQQVTHPDIDVTLSSVQRVDITLPIGTQETRVEVVGGSSVLSVTGTQEHGISPETLQAAAAADEQRPALVGVVRDADARRQHGRRHNAFDARINGGLQSGDEASVDGVSMQQGFMSQGGMVSIFQDFPMSPDMVSEVKVLTSNYAPEYGVDDLRADHGGHQVRRQLVSRRGVRVPPQRLAERDAVGRGGEARRSRNNFGANIGGPAKLPGLWSDSVKSYFYFNYEGYRQTGGSNQPTLSIPSLQERNGDFTRLARRQPAT